MRRLTQKSGALLLGLALAVSLLTLALAAEPEPQTAHATYWRGQVRVEGQTTYLFVDEEKLHFINLDGNVYVPLVVGAEWSKATTSLQWGSDNINFLYDYLQPRVPHDSSDVSKSTPEDLEKYNKGLTEGFEVTVLPNLTTSIRGVPFQTTNAQGEPLYPISYEGVTYIPIRTVATVGGFGFWLHEKKNPILSDFTLYLFLPPTQAQLDAGREYADRLEAVAKKLEPEIIALEKNRLLTYDQMIAKFKEIRAIILQARDLSIPSASTLTQQVLRFHSDLDLRVSTILDSKIDLPDPLPGTISGWRTVVPNNLQIDVLGSMNYYVDLIRALCDGMAAGMA